MNYSPSIPSRRDSGFIPLLRIVLLLIMFMPVRAMAYDWMWDASSYQITGMGSKISLKLPVYDKDGRDMWVTYGYIYVSAQGMSQKQLLFYKSQGNIASSSKNNYTTFKTSMGGVLKVMDPSGSWVRVTSGGIRLPIYSDGDRFTAELEWEPPYEWRGKSLTFSLVIYGDQYSWKEWYKEFTKTGITTTDPPKAEKPSIMSSMLNVDDGHRKEISVIWQINANEVTQTVAHYKEDGVAKTDTLKAETFGTFSVPSDKLIDSLYVEVDYKDSEGNTVTGQISEYYDVPYFHQAKNLNASMLEDGSVKLTWKVDNASRQDIMPTDYWLIQRNTNGAINVDDSQWTNISQVSFEQNQSSFTYTDESLLADYQYKPVYYRVQRASVANNWGYGETAGGAKDGTVQQLALPDILTVNAVRASGWGQNDAHKVNVTWTVDQSKGGQNGFTYPISDKSDWEEFCAIVAMGNTTLNAMLLNDVDISDSENMLGESDAMYCGTFDGHGHTLTIGYGTDSSPFSERYCAPFRYVGEGAIIKCLHTVGTITTQNRFAGGIIGLAEGGTTLANCRSSVTITSQVSGDGSHGGLIGRSERKLTINDCLFDGKLLGPNTNSCGGIIGWIGSYNYTRKLNSVLFNPQEVTVNSSNSSTFYRGSTATLNNCYYTKTLGTVQGTQSSSIAGILEIDLGAQWEAIGDECLPKKQDQTKYIRNQSDWKDFAYYVNIRSGYVNAVLLSDISLEDNYEVSATYKGVFDGQGHTIHLDHWTWGDGLFNEIEGATIMNLHVAGESREPYEKTGIIVGTVKASSEPSCLYNCRVSPDIILGTFNSVGGLVGLVEDGAEVDISDCLIDAKFIARSGSRMEQDCGFVGAIEGISKVSLKNCLFNPSEIDGTIKNCKTFARYGDKASVTIKNCYYTKTLGDAQGTNASSKSASQLLAALGDQWQLNGDAVIPMVTRSNLIYPEGTRTYVWDNAAQMKLYTDKYVGSELRYTEEHTITESERKAGSATLELTSPCVNYGFRVVLERGSSKLHIGLSDDQTLTSTKKYGASSKFYFDNIVKMDSLKSEQQHDAVRLSWVTSGGDADYFEVYRRDTTIRQTAFQLIAEDVHQAVYLDKTVKAHHGYEYKVKAVTQCEGLHVDSLTCSGQCDAFGRVSGYVRMPNGTGIGGVKVKAVPSQELVGVGKERITTTEDDGYFLLDSLYYLSTNGLYDILVQTTGDGGGYTTATCNFTEDKNEFTNVMLAQQEYYVFSGKVLYDGSSIPVPGAQFRMDNKPLYDYKQKRVETDNQGAFAISVPPGTHRIQVEKDGHVFENDGYYIDQDNKQDPTQHNWQRNIADVYLWDQTKVTLRGRMVGGEIQGSKPLGQSLSYNNLGDNLKMVMQLEGDNTSWIVRDQLDLSVKERKDSLRHGVTDPKTHQPKDITRWEMTRHSITVHPDVTSGEYEIKLYPVKYKITEQSCTGYPTLFQQGKVGETLDLSRYGNDSIAEYKCVYHTPVKLDVKQVNQKGENFFGESFYKAIDVKGNNEKVDIWLPKTASQPERYTLGHPVFMSQGVYLFTLQAQEEYCYNNRTDTVPDIVKLHEGMVYFHNDLVGDLVTDSVKLDTNGYGTYMFSPKNTTFLGNDESSLRTLDINLLYDGVYYDVKPFNGDVLRAYVMGAVPKANGRQTVAKGGTHLIDILRDPPGANSYAYIESGSKYSYSYSWNMNGGLGLTMGYESGTGTNIYQGAWAGNLIGTQAGTFTQATTSTKWSVNFSVLFGGDAVYTYDMITNKRIQTSSDNKWVGPKADIYIGMTDNIITEDAVAVRMVPESQFEQLKHRTNGRIQLDGHSYDIKNGTVQVLATGIDSKGKKVYLISDEVCNYYAQFNSDFAYTGHYIETELIPNLLKLRNERILPMGTTETEAKTIANRDKRNVYISKVAFDDPEFGYHAAIASDTVAKYEIIHPDSSTGLVDEVEQYNKEVIIWASFIAQNEKEKLAASGNADLVKNFDFDGAANVQYSETYDVTESNTLYLLLEPVSVTLPSFATKTLGDLIEAAKHVDETQHIVTINPGSGSSFSLSFKPIVNYNFDDKYGQVKDHTKTTGFVLNASSKSNLSVSVYRSRISKSDIEKLVAAGDADVFLKYSKESLEHISSIQNWMSYLNGDENLYGNFIFRTNGGATAAPWEDERRTKFYQPGTVYDQKTLKIDQLRLWTDQSIVSNVPHDEPARFTVYLCNESPTPDKASPLFTLGAPDSKNQNGARIMFGGNALNGTGYTVALNPGEVVAKQIEVYAGEAFDYENLGLELYDQNDLPQTVNLELSAHFVPTAGKVNISTPGNKWVVNTESPYDEEQRGYYMPVRIDGFNVNQRNFDHIELQYKLSTQGDKDWVNICSYYKSDSLMALASGTCRLIETDGYIMTSFFGEKDPIEQYYDLRAVVYCRYGNGYLTSSSPILSGIKDTRRPQPFGTPKPENGILGIGDDISIAFSEAIAGNYLSEVNNFEVLGYTNSTNITQGTCLRFDGIDVGAQTNAVRNLAEKSFTLDMMINPDEHTKGVGILWHGDQSNGFGVGLKYDNRLWICINGASYYSEQPIQFNGLHHISIVFRADVENSKTYIDFYDGNTKIGTGTYDKLYEGVGPISLGPGLHYKTLSWFRLVEKDTDPYQGTMLEFRLWNKALGEEEISRYAKKRLTGYEPGLLDNFALSEGRGNVCINKALGGSDLMLKGATWSVPAGLSVKLDGQQGLVLNDSAFVRKNSQDYTLMFWFRTDDSNGTLLANGPAQDEPQWKNHFNIGLKDGKLYYRNGKFEVNSGNLTYNDGAWHHLTVTLNRSRNVGNLYVDEKLLQSFAVDTLGGILGGTLAAGITYKDAYNTSDAIKGNIDEVALYEMALPLAVIKDYAGSTPLGREMGTLVYLPFSRMEKQKSNEQRMVASGQSIKQSRDNQGNYSTRMDVIVSDSLMQLVSDRESYAPIDNSGQRENLNYSYVADKQNLLINLDEPDANLEKTNVYITVRDVTDLNGNLLENPIMMDLYVYRNPLRWSTRRLNVETSYAEGADVDVTITNLSGKKHSYYIEDLPQWITMSRTSGTISATDEETVTLHISPFINVGDYDEVINLMTEDGLNEPLPIHIKVRGDTPEWAVSNTMKGDNITMIMIARVKLDDVIADDPDDIIGVFGDGHETQGLAHLNVDNTANANEPLAFVTVYGKSITGEQPLRIEYLDASTGRLHVLKREDGQKLQFVPDTIMGSTTNPVILVNSGEEVHRVKLQKGWNWVSFFVRPEEQTVESLLNGATKWEVGDALEIVRDNNPYLYSYKGEKNPYNPTIIKYYWDNKDDSLDIDPTLMYRFNSGSEKMMYLSGRYSNDKVTVKKGWNRIGYISHLNLPIGKALAEYTDRGTAGDIIKSQDEFAVLVEDAAGNRTWKGSLTHLSVGQGYMLKHVGNNSLTFNYPNYNGGLVFIDSPVGAPLFENTTGNSMNIVARTQGVEVQQGDRMLVYDGTELCGKAEMTDEGLFFLSVADCTGKRLSFAIERGEELIAVTGERMKYKTNDVVGTIGEPTVIDFTSISRYADGQWYDLQGRKLNKRPRQTGVYIYNGQKTIVE